MAAHGHRVFPRVQPVLSGLGEHPNWGKRARQGSPGRSQRMQRVVCVAGLRSLLAGGCRCDQDTRAALADAGFHVESLAERTLVNVPVVRWTWMGSSRP